MEINDQKSPEGYLSKEIKKEMRRKNKGSSAYAQLASQSLNQRNNEKVIRFLTQMNKHE